MAMAQSLRKLQVLQSFSPYVNPCRSIGAALQQQLPAEAQVVVCGAGIVGNSVAYHLVQHGLTDILVIDKET